MNIVQFDDVSLGIIQRVTKKPQAVGCYGDSEVENAALAMQLFPDAYHLIITTNGISKIARCCDCENFDFTIDGASRWGADKVHNGIKPVQYMSAGNIQAIINAYAAQGVERTSYWLWSAHIGQGKHICGPRTCGYPQVDGTQWTFTYDNLSLDCSELDGFAWYNQVPVIVDMHYDRHPDTPVFHWKNLILSERGAVERYDHLRVKPRMNKEALDELREFITFLRKRVWYITYYDPATGQKRPHAEWELYFRNWRWHKLDARARGVLITS